MRASVDKTHVHTGHTDVCRFTRIRGMIGRPEWKLFTKHDKIDWCESKRRGRKSPASDSSKLDAEDLKLLTVFDDQGLTAACGGPARCRNDMGANRNC